MIIYFLVDTYTFIVWKQLKDFTGKNSLNYDIRLRVRRYFTHLKWDLVS